MSDETSYTKSNGPRIIKKHKESDFTNPTSSWFKLTTILGTASVVPAWQLINEPYSANMQIALGVCSIAATRYWLKYCGMDPKVADRSWTHFWFWVDKKLGRHTYNRLTTGVSWFEQLLGRKMSVVYPVVEIHPDGLVQFDDNQYVVYADLHAQKPSDEERKLRRIFMKSVVDGMYDNQIIKIISTSKRNPRKPVIDYLMKLANKQGSKERAKHLNALIRMAIQSNQAKVTREYIMIGLGQHETLKSAQIAKNSKVNGMLLNLKRAKLRPRLIVNKRQIEKLLREASSETAVF